MISASVANGLTKVYDPILKFSVVVKAATKLHGKYLIKIWKTDICVTHCRMLVQIKVRSFPVSLRWSICQIML